MKRMLMGAVVALVVAGCERPTDVLIEGRRPMGEVPAVYREWYATTEACVGRSGDFDAVRWHVADRIEVPSSGRGASGFWRHPNEITIRADKVLNERIVRHEAMHDIMQMGSELHRLAIIEECAPSSLDHDLSPRRD